MSLAGCAHRAQQPRQRDSSTGVVLTVLCVCVHGHSQCRKSCDRAWLLYRTALVHFRRAKTFTSGPSTHRFKQCGVTDKQPPQSVVSTSRSRETRTPGDQMKWHIVANVGHHLSGHAPGAITWLLLPPPPPPRMPSSSSSSSSDRRRWPSLAGPWTRTWRRSRPFVGARRKNKHLQIRAIPSRCRGRWRASCFAVFDSILDDRTLRRGLTRYAARSPSARRGTPRLIGERIGHFAIQLAISSLGGGWWLAD